MPSNGHPDWVQVPVYMRAFIEQQLGYTPESWRMRLSEFNQYKKAYEAAQNTTDGPGGGGDGGDTNITINQTGGSSGGSSAPSAQQLAALRDNYIQMLFTFDMSITKNLQNLMDKGVNNLWGSTSFLVHLRQTKDYKQMFPGIKGSGLSETQYNDKYDAYKNELKALAGKPLSRNEFAILVKKDVNETEWGMRVEFLRRSSRDPEFFDQIQAVAKARGWVKPKDQLSYKEMYNAMIRKGDARIEGLLEEANANWLIQNAGFTVGTGGDISRKQVLDFIKTMESQGKHVETFTSENFAQLAATAAEVIPAAELAGAGISKADLFILEFGGPGQNEIRRLVEGVMEAHANIENKRVRSVLVEDESGSRLLGASPREPRGL